ncbi:hypothetical protein ACKWTF_013550 [Chironomus riparius]
MATATFDPINKIWSGLKLKPLYNSDQNLGYLILQILQQTPDSVTQISADTGVSVTCQQMYDRSIKIAKYLTTCGMKEGDLIGLVAANTENLAPIVFASFTLGLPVNPLSPAMNEKDIVQMFSMTKPKMIFCDAENVKIVQNAVDEMKSEAKILTVMNKIDGYKCATEILRKMEGERTDFEFKNIDSSATAIILCSSGSTGFPKGICKSHKSIIEFAYSFFEKPRGHQIVMLQSSSIFWISGFNILIFCVLYRSTRITTAKPFDPFMIADIINKYQVTDLITPPFVFVDLLQKPDLKPFTSIDNWFVGGMIVSESLCERFKHFVPNGKIVNGFACTEESLLTVNNSEGKFGSIGTVVENAELKIVDENGISLGPDQLGEIYSKVPVQFSEYFNHPEKTAEAFEDGWFKTGDIGYYDAAGFFYIVDRKKDLMKYYNYQITSSEIEMIIDEIEGIISSCVVGVPNSETGNDIIHAFVIVDKSKNLQESFILDYVNKKVIDPKRIRGGVHIVDSFPLGLTQKVDRKAVREMAKNY